MKLGKPKRYTWFRNAIDTSDSSSSSSSSTSSKKVHENSQPSIIAMAHPNSQHHYQHLVISMSSWLRVPKGRIFRQILATAICLILVYNVTSLAIETSSIPSSSSTGAVESLPAAAAALTLCESCEDDSSDASNQISQPQNGVNDKNYIGKHELPIVGTNAKTGSQGKLGKNHPDEVSSKTIQQSDNDSENNFAPPPLPQPAETSGSNYIYYYTDDISNRNRRNQNINYDINSPGADGENGDSNSNSDNQVLTTNSRGDDDDDGNSGYANRDEMERNDISMRSSNSNASSKSQKHSSAVKLRNRQSEKRASKKLLNLQYQKRRKLLDSIFLSIKSTKRFHKTRLEPVISTWFNLARDQVNKDDFLYFAFSFIWI